MPFALTPTSAPAAWAFETPMMRGELSADPGGNRHGVTSLVQLSTGRQIVQPGLYCLHLYRVLSRNHWLSQCRDVPHEGEIEGDELVIRWAADTLGPGLSAEARYAVVADEAIDLTVTLRNERGWHRDLELYTSNYLQAGMFPGVYTARPYSGPAWSVPGVLTRPTASAATAGCYHAWPRDSFAAQKFTDGRWEYGTHSPVPWVVGRWLAQPLGLYATDDRRTLAVVMARYEDCFGVCTSYRSDDPTDDVAHHNSLYHNLVGEDVGPGWERTLRQRLVIAEWEDDETPLRALAAFVGQ